MNTNLTINIGKDEYGKDITINLFETKNLLIAGSTGSGKSVLLHKIVTTLLSNNSPEDLKLIMIDPKRVELTMYKEIPHLLTKVIMDPKRAVLAMKWAVKEIDRRYDILNESGCKDISNYNGKEKMPPILFVIDEFSDFMQIYPKELESVVLKVVSIGYSVGVHMILSTSRPSAKVYTKAIQGAFTSRIALQVASKAESKLIIGTDEACNLRGSGDILFRIGMKYVIRGQVDNVSEKEVKAVTKILREEYKNSILSNLSVDESDYDKDDMYEIVKEEVLRARKVSTSYIQRKFDLGYSRSAQLVDLLEKKGVIGPAKGTKPREVIMK